MPCGSAKDGTEDISDMGAKRIDLLHRLNGYRGARRIWNETYCKKKLFGKG